MDSEKPIYLPDTTIKYGDLKNNLKRVYGLEVVTKTQKYLYLGLVGVLTIIVLKNIIKKQ